MVDIVCREAVYLWFYGRVQFEQIVGYWALGIVLGSVISVFGKATIFQMLGSLRQNRLGAFGVIPASIIGIISPLCMYGTIPIAASFSKKGISDDWLAAFMMSSVLLNPQLIIYSAALGIPALAVRIAACFLCGIAAGLCVRLYRAGNDRPFFNFAGFAEPAGRDTDPHPALRLVKNIGRNIKATGPYFLAGIALSAAFQRYIPERWMITLFGGDTANSRAFGILMAATIGVPLYTCGGGTIPLLRWWLDGGMSMGAACAFMITGPATKITNLGALKIVLGLKRFLLYIMFTITFAFVSGLLVDIVFRSGI